MSDPRSSYAAIVLVSTGLLWGLGCARSAPPAFDPSRVIAHVETQCRFGPRVPGTAARDSAAAYLAHTLERFGADVSLQSFDVRNPYGENDLRLLNVIGSFGLGRDRRVLLMAHYDSRPWADQEPDSTLHSQPISGAVDGACSTGILLEMARLLGSAMPPEIGVDVVLFDGEDYGREGDLDYYLLGSKYFVEHLAGYRPEKAILLDMVGGVETKVARERFSVEHARELADSVFARAAELGLDYFVPDMGPPIVDDHVPLLQAGIDAVDIFGYEYPHWHTLADTPDKCDPDLISQVGTLLVDFLYRYPFE